jgi:SSS family solute:Na+ symporter|tara:strand:- start:1268 stop:2731 length:1464 start_codon:yes stop_codon:yes gene_type:complete
MDVFDYIVFFGYLLGVTLFGASFYKKNKTSSDFILGNKNIPSWVVGMSIFATFVSSISYLALPGSAYLSNWNAFVFSLSIPVASFLAVKVFVPLYRSVNSPSAYTFMENRFGPWARVYVSIFYLLTQLMRVGTILYLMGLTIHAIFEWNIVTIIVITGIAVMFYTILGGIQAVIWTDAIQGIILIAGALVCAGYILSNMPEGPSQLFSIAIEQNKFSLGSFSLDLTKSTFWVVFIYGLCINLQNYGIDQNYVQRYIIAKTDREAKLSAFFGGILYIPVCLIFLFIGTGLFAFYQSGAGILPLELMDETKSDRIFPYFIVTELPRGITGLMIASIFAAGMSTISTSFNSSATVFFTDYYQRYFNTGASEKDAMRVLYISSFVIGIIGITISILMINVKSALDTWWKLASIFSGGSLGLFLLGVFSKSKNVIGSVIGVILGLLVILWLTISPLLSDNAFGSQFHTYLITVFGTATIFLVGFIFSLIYKK